ncbi:hypothetical protein RKE29_02115 [Streptomyces sp. B1866]|uniref:hypothetical protein n=1 Tax=Streptomyces sp. B1866 TaxID=3075431 RepID=UPI00288D44C2|nr:hypothetical protein [Streptomyces sp. B1866]MDT3395456.1 hypothetical protein [Streptomyces sp. B1866]
MTVLSVWLWPALALLGALGLVACSRREPGRYLLPAARTVALLTVAGAYVAFLFHR